MKKYFAVLKQVGLFKTVDAAGLEAMLKCLAPEVKVVGKNEAVLLAGDKPRFLGIVLSGQLHIIRDDYDGNSSLIAVASPGEIFAESLCCAGVAESPVTVIASNNTTVMLLEFDRIIHTCSNACAFHQKLIENMLNIVANKNLFLQSRMEIMVIKSIRSKVLHYLETFASKQGRNMVIPLNREELANYLCVERSALSHELSKMKKDGLIEYKKNAFVLL